MLQLKFSVKADFNQFRLVHCWRARRYGLDTYEGFSFPATRREMRHKVYKYICEGLLVPCSCSTVFISLRVRNTCRGSRVLSRLIGIYLFSLRFSVVFHNKHAYEREREREREREVVLKSQILQIS
jgi:hypothetical protein